MTNRRRLGHKLEHDSGRLSEQFEGDLEMTRRHSQTNRTRLREITHRERRADDCESNSEITQREAPRRLGQRHRPDCDSCRESLCETPKERERIGHDRKRGVGQRGGSPSLTDESETS